MSAVEEHRGAQYVIVRTGLTYRQLDYWIRYGAIDIEDGDPKGTGGERSFTLQEVNDLEVIARIVRSARSAGFAPDRRAISAMWHALQSGENWRLVFDIYEEAP